MSINLEEYVPRCPGCDRPLIHFEKSHADEGDYYDVGAGPVPPGDWTCVGCPTYGSSGKWNRFFWSHRMPHPPGTPDETILKDIKENLENTLAYDKRYYQFSARSTYAIIFLLKKLEESKSPKWISGRPNGVGSWMIECNSGDRSIVTVEEDFNEEKQQKYLRVNDSGFSEPLDDLKSEVFRFVRWSYGPMPERP